MRDLTIASQVLYIRIIIQIITMNKLQLPQAKLLFAIAELYRKRQIDETEKRILKCKHLSS
jgi:hypothetical protein